MPRTLQQSSAENLKRGSHINRKASANAVSEQSHSNNSDGSTRRIQDTVQISDRARALAEVHGESSE